METTMADAAPVDEFAQTRGADDLFDDEIMPISHEAQTQDQQADVQAVEDVATITTNTPENGSSARRGRGSHRGAAQGGERGRGRGRGRGGRGGRAAQEKAQSPKPKEGSVEAVEGQQNADAVNQQSEDIASKDSPDKAPADTSPTPPTKAETPRVQAVRGDRSGTGGVKKPKLTEEELAERMAAAKINAAKVAAAHARAEADEASFHEREKVAAEKRRQEFINRRAMDGEREKNRLRKLGAQTGREWDAEKREEDFTDRRGGSQYRRGMHGGIAAHSRPAAENGDGDADGDGDFASRGRARGGPRGGRGGRGGRGRGGARGSRGAPNRDGQDSTHLADHQSAPGLDNESDFPALPGKENQETKPPSGEAKLVPPNLEGTGSPASPISPAVGTWAEQVESSAR